MNICIISACTEDYYYRLYVLYLGLRKYHKDIFFHAHLINMKEEEKKELEKIEDKYLEISYSTIELTDKDENKNKEVIKNYATNIRSKLSNDLINNYDKVFWFDADTIIRNDISELFSFLDTKLIVAYKNYFPKEKILTRGEYKGGILGFRRCPLIIKILKEWNKETFKNGKEKCYWFQDQILITKLIFKYYNFLSIHILHKKYIDWDFDINSPIWVGKGQRKNNEIYLLEESKILKK